MKILPLALSPYISCLQLNMGLSLIFFPACLHVACVVQQKDARQWFAELSVDMEKVVFKIPLIEYKLEHFKVNVIFT